jgi:anti-sigma regulatory factor (Ser/Thr protein kinase)
MMRRISVVDISQVAGARRAAAVAAREAGFGEADEGRVALIATELSSNLVRHGHGGELLLGSADEGEFGLIALDRGPGMVNVAACMRDGFSTAGTPGTGLGAVVRQSDFFDVHSALGSGTGVLARLRPMRATAPPTAIACASVCLAKHGEDVCGDAWAFTVGEGRAALLVADGLGHGPLAAEASREAVRLFRRAPLSAPATLLDTIHAGLRPTRGAAVAVARLDLQAKEVVYSGVGNVAGTLVVTDGVRRMVSLNGTAGHAARRIQEFRYAFASSPLIVLTSDGLGTSWSLDRYPGLVTRDPLLIAAILYRDFDRGRDDVTVAVLKAATPS